MKKDLKKCDGQCFLCRHCSPEWTTAIELNKKMLHYKKGENIFREGENVTGIYFLNAGKVKVHKQWEDTKELIIRFAKESDILGHRGFGNTDVYPISATALEAVTVCYIDMKFFLASLKVNQDFTFQLLTFYANELRDAEKRMRDLAHMDVRGRLADAILMLQDKFGENTKGYIDIAVTRQEIASFAGTTYETFFKVVSELVKEKIIKFSGKSIRILKKARLEAYAKKN